MDQEVEALPPVAHRYRLLRKVGNGQMSSVYQAEDLRRPDTLVAVKLLNTAHPDQLRKEFFRRETQALERLDHPRIVRILDRGWSEEHSCFYLILEWLSYSFEELRAKRNREPGWRGKLMLDLANALAHAHSVGIVHRDIKPSNILFDTGEFARLSDFGISRLKNELSTGLTLAHFFSLPYASPEQRRGAAGDERSDIYSLGVVFYELLAGHPPTSDGPTSDDIGKLKDPENVRNLLQHMVSARPEDRPQDMLEVLRLLRAEKRSAIAPAFYLITASARGRS